jgi:hypothetical protein
MCKIKLYFLTKDYVEKWKFILNNHTQKQAFDVSL